MDYGGPTQTTRRLAPGLSFVLSIAVNATLLEHHLLDISSRVACIREIIDQGHMALSTLTAPETSGSVLFAPGSPFADIRQESCRNATAQVQLGDKEDLGLL